MKKRYFGLIASALIMALSVVSCAKGDEKGDKPKTTGPATAQAVSTTAALVEGRAIDRIVDVTGTIYPVDEVIVSNEGPGTVASIKADLGDSVNAGDTLAELDQREAKLNLEDAQASYVTSVKTLEKEKARLTDARSNLKRYNDLFKNAMVSESQHDAVKTQYTVAEATFKEAEARVEQAQARLNLFKKRFSDTVVKAPISGEVKKRYMSVGESVRDKAPMFVIVNSRTLKFKGTISESSAPDVKPGQKVHINVEAYKGRVFEGIVKRVSPAVETDTRTMEIEAHVPNKDNTLKPGYFAKGIIETQKEEGISFVPDGAVYSFVGITKVFVLKEGKASERPIKTGQRSGGFIEVVGNVLPGETVATSNLMNLFEGASVNIQGAAPAASKPAEAAQPQAAKQASGATIPAIISKDQANKVANDADKKATAAAVEANKAEKKK